jgi:RHS repeat-associated protein
LSKKVSSIGIALLVFGLLPVLQPVVTAEAAGYSATIQADSPAVYYRLGESSGSSAADASGNNRTGTYAGTVTLGAAGALVGDNDTAVSFGGGYVQYAAGTGLPTGTSARTFESWVKTTSTADQVVLSYGGQGNGYCNNLESGLGLTAGSQVTFITAYDCNGGYTPLTVGAPRQIADGSWHLLDATWDGTTVTAYLDGHAIGSQAFSTSLGTTDSNGLEVGRETDARRAFSGSLDEVAVYPAALTSAQVLAHFNASGNAPPTAPGTPTVVSASGQATVSWTAATSQASAPVLGYVVTAYQGSNPVNSTGAGASATSATLSGLTGSTAYTVQVQAVNSFGSGTSSTSAAFTPTGPASTYTSTVIGDAPAVYYRVSDGGSLAADSSGHGHLAYYSGGTQGAAGALTNDGDAAWSTGGSGYIKLWGQTGIPTGTSARTFEAWVNTTSASDQIVVSYGGVNNAYCNYQESGLGVSSGNQVTFSVNYDCNGNYSPLRFSAARPISDGHWHDLVATWDGTTVTAYLDSQSLGAQSYVSSLGSLTSDGVQIGRETDARRNFNGAIDEVAIYPTSLSAAQVLAHFNGSGNARPAAPGTPSVVSGAGKATVTWTTATSPSNAPVLGYLITAYLGSNPVNSIATGASATSATLNGLKGSTSYTIQVQAMNSFGTGPGATSAAFTPSGPTSTYSSTVLGDGPATYYRLSDGGPAAADSSGHGQVAYYSGGTQGSPGAVANDSDAAWSTGGTGYIKLWGATGIPTGTSARSFEAWVSTTSTSDQVIVSYGGSNNAYCNYQESGLGTANGNQVTFLVNYDCNGGYSPLRFTASKTISDGHWHHLAATWDGTTVTAYLDGQSLGTQSYSSSLGPLTSDGVQIGRETDARRNFNGTIDELAVYPSTLSASQVLAHFNATGNTLPGAPTNVVGTSGVDSATVTWSRPSGSGSITGYAVTASGTDLTPVTVNVDGSATRANLNGLAGNQTYTFAVTAQNAVGAGPTSGASAPVTIASAAVVTGGPTPPFGNYIAWRMSPSVNGSEDYPAGTMELISKDSLPAQSNWTVETWIKNFASQQTTESGAGIGVLDPNQTNPTLAAGIGIDAGGNFSAVWPVSGGEAHQALNIPSTDWCGTCPWVHVAVSYDGSDVRGFVNGQLVADVVVAGAGAPAAKAGVFDTSAIKTVAFDDLRISAVAQYTANFTVPTAALGTSGASLLWHFDDHEVTRYGSFYVVTAATQSGTDSPGVSADASGGGHSMHIDTLDSTAHTPGLFHQYYYVYFLGQGPTMDELDASGSCWMCTHPPLYGDPINTVTGEFWQTADDLAIPGRGLPIDFNRTYSSNRASVNGPLGYGWSFSYGISLSLDGSGNATVSQSTGAKTVFNWNSTTSTFSAAPRTIATLVKNGDGTFTLTQKDQSRLNFDANGHLTSEVDPDGYSTTLAYNGSGQLSTITDPAGRALTVTFTGANITKIADPAGRSVSYGYDGSGNLTTVTDLGGGITSYSYDASHELTNLKDAKCTAGSCPGTTNTYSGGQVTQQQDPLGRVTKFSYSSTGVGSTTTITDPRNNQTQEEYLNGLLISRTEALGTSLQATWTYQYDPVTLAETAVTDPLGRTTTMTYDSEGNLLTSTDPLGRTTTRASYNSHNEPGTVTDPTGVTTTYSYNSTGKLLSKSIPLNGGGNAVTAYAYDSSQPGDLLTVTDPENRVTTYTYNTDGDRVSSTDNAGDKTTYAFDGVGRMTSSVSPLGNASGGNPSQYTTNYTTNAFGDVLTVTDPLSHVTTYGYDPNRNRTSVEDQNNHTTGYSFDFDNELTLVTRPDSSTQATGYDGDGNVTSQTDGLNHATTYAYDALNRKTSVTDALNRMTSYAYDLAGNLTSMTDATGAVTSYSFDAGNELSQVAYQTAQPGTVGYQYDKDGRRTQMTDGTGSTSYQYDNLGRLTSSTDSSGATVGYGYDKSSLITSIVYPSSLGTVSRTYDAAGRLKTVSDWLSHQTTYSYDANSELTGIAYPNTVATTEGYDRAGHLTSISDQQGSNSPFFSETYGRDSAGQLTSDGTNSFGYDTVNRLTSGGSQTYAYDNADRVTAIDTSGGNQGALAYDNADQLSTDTITNGGTQVQKYTYGYDANGNRVSRTDASSNVSNYGWDQASHLLSYAAGTTTADYAYNGDGLRTSKTVNGSSEAFTWDTAEGLPLMIKDGWTAYVTGLGGLPLEQISGTTVLYYHQDQLGSTRAVTGSSGTVQQTYAFDAYGNLTSGSGSVSNPFQYAGQYLDTESGLDYLRARYLDPASGQFMSLDPLVEKTRQPFAYTVDSPLDRIDPSGLLCTSGDLNQCDWGAGWSALSQGVASIRPNGPAYVTVEAGYSAGPGVTGSLTLTRSGSLFIGGGYGDSAPGFSAAARAGWIDGVDRPSCKQVDDFVNGPSLSYSGYAPALGVPLVTGVGPSVGQTWGNEGGTHLSDWGTEVGVGIGAGHQVGFSQSTSGKIWSFGQLW